MGLSLRGGGRRPSDSIWPLEEEGKEGNVTFEGESEGGKGTVGH